MVKSMGLASPWSLQVEVNYSFKLIVQAQQKKRLLLADQNTEHDKRLCRTHKNVVPLSPQPPQTNCPPSSFTTHVYFHTGTASTICMHAHVQQACHIAPCTLHKNHIMSVKSCVPNCKLMRASVPLPARVTAPEHASPSTFVKQSS